MIHSFTYCSSHILNMPIFILSFVDPSAGSIIPVIYDFKHLNLSSFYQIPITFLDFLTIRMQTLNLKAYIT